MGKTLKNKTLMGRRSPRILLALGLSATLATAGCTTNRTLGDGQPTGTDPGLRSAPSSGVTSGTEHAPAVPPMTSSYTFQDPDRSTQYVAAGQAAAVLARAYATPSVRVLGPSDPAEVPAPSPSAALAAEYAARSPLNTPPRVTINSSISSPATPLVGAIVDDGFVAGAEGFFAGVVDGPAVSAPANVAAASLSPTAAAAGVPVGAFAAGGGQVAATAPLSVTGGTAATPTMISGGVPPVTAVSGVLPVLRTPSPASASGVIPRSSSTVAPLQSPSTVSPAVPTTTRSVPVRLTRSPDGRLVLSNSR